MALPGRRVHDLTVVQNRDVATCVSVVRRDEADGAVHVLVVVPVHEIGGPGARVLEAVEGARVAGPERVNEFETPASRVY